MRPTPSAALTAVLAAILICAGAPSGARAQQQAEPAAPPAAAAPPPSESGLSIEWQVRNRFRLFRREADFLRHVTANRAGNQLAAEHLLERDTEGRGWAQNEVDHLCLNAAGGLLDTCDRDGEKENYLAPKTHAVVARLAGPVPPDATCNWSFDDGTVPPKQVTAPCTQPVQQRLAYGKPTIAAVGVTRADGSVDSVSAEIAVRDLLIAGLGDSVAAGEGNPDRPIALSDDGFCFRRFLGAARSEYFRPARQGYKGDKACDDSPAGSAASTSDWNSHGARWMSAACHRSLYGYQLRTALALAVENPTGRGHLPAARLHRRDHRGRPVQVAGRQRLPGARRLRRLGAAAARPVAGHARQGAPADAGPPARPRPAHGRRKRHQVRRPRRRRHHQHRHRAHAVQPGRPACDGAAGAGPPRPGFARQLRQASQRAEAAGRRQPVPRRLRVLRPSGDAGRRALPRRPRRPRHPSGFHRRRPRG